MHIVHLKGKKTMQSNSIDVQKIKQKHTTNAFKRMDEIDDVSYDNEYERILEFEDMTWRKFDSLLF